ncbi:UDP-N-acetyl-alpha-D-muramoyl-L-alanyl-L-glutamate epimerase-like [Tubulanus polymorphus]|uniref:UDP-N-acetyl-alpha-D-muramoyl-L-alanyl-L- glutamate epimerase-like n=1 Tax=Tubulanus polymorphus TaxID=672921 RepID=UPI003DA4E905
MTTITLKSYTRSKHQISTVYGVDDLQFTTSMWYHDVNFYDLENIYGKDYMDRVYFHIVVFDMNKLQSVKPKHIDLGPYERYHTVEFENLWLKHFSGAFSQWLYENDLHDYKGPTFLHKANDKKFNAVETTAPDGPEVLSLNGGGKDSLLSMSIFDKVGVEYGTLVFSSSVYGTSRLQLRLTGDLVKNCSKSHRHHQLAMYDDFLDSPITDLRDDVDIKTLQEDETIKSVFSVLPFVLQYRYRYVNLGHEKSAEYPNLIWDKNGLPVNHQYCKSIAAQILEDTYIKNNLVSNCTFFSVLKPLNDVMIFSMLNSVDPKYIPYTHSCNKIKPWCKRCAKCAYIWLAFMAYQPTNLIDSIFNENLFDVDEIQIFYRQLLGLEKHNAFECVGQIDETRLAFELCRRKGLKGKAMDIYIDEVSGRYDQDSAIMKLTEVDTDYDRIPSKFAEDIMALFSEQEKVARDFLKGKLIK